MIDIPDRLAFLECAARHFEHQPTGGEDKAHWANVYNAKNCREIATLLLTQKDRLDKLEAAKTYEMGVEDAAKVADAARRAFMAEIDAGHVPYLNGIGFDAAREIAAQIRALTGSHT